MYLKSLEIRGFKSFPDKTILNFDRGITAVVGPNGSGKSNISDAVRWVLGEQSAKTLRGGRMEDVIFGGTQKRNAVGFAQVSITINNADHILDLEAEEVIISRKYYRSGESEYRVNGNSVRLRDIHEMLMDTGLGKDGYSMIGQGKIAEIVSVKSTERREIFEEAAGISKYRYRKEQSERQLEMAKENLLRLKDIIVEIEGRLEPLRIQSEKATKFVELMNEKKSLEVSLFVHDLADIKNVIRKYENQIMICQTNYDETEEKLQDIEKATQHVYLEMNETSVKIDALAHDRTEIGDEITENAAQIAVWQNDILHKNEDIKRLELDLDASKGNTSAIDEHINEKRDESLIIAEKIGKLDVQISDLESKLTELINSSRQHSDEITDLTFVLNDLTKKESQATVDYVTAISSVNEINNHISTLSGSTKEKEAQLDKLQDEQKKLREYFDQLESKIDSDKNILNGYSMKLGRRQEKYSELEGVLSKQNLASNEISQRIKLLSDMERNMEDFSYSVKNVMKMAGRGELDGIHGPVSKLISVPSGYAVAVETALLGGIQNIVVDDENVAKRAINILKRGKMGRATFLPLTSVKGNKINTSGFENAPGFVGVGSELVEYDKRYTGIMNYLLGRTVFFETLDDAVDVAKRQGYKFRIVTLDGQVINAGGSLTGGSNIKTAGLLTRRGEIKTLQKKLEEVFSDKQRLETEYQEMNRDIGKIKADFEAWDSSIKTMEEDKIKCGFQLESISQKINETIFQIEQYKSDVAASLVRVKNLEEKTKLSGDLKEKLQADIDEIQGQLEQKDSGRKNLKDSMDALSEKVNASKIDKLSLQKDLDMANQFISDQQSRKTLETEKLGDISEEIAHCRDTVENIKSDIAKAEQNNADMRLQIEQIDAKSTDLVNHRQALEKSISGTRQQEIELLSGKEDISKEIARLQERKLSQNSAYDEVVAKLWDEYEMTVSEGGEFAETIDNLPKSKTKLATIKSEIRSLGSVNVDSIEEYVEVKDRYEYLTEQFEDVESSKNRLIKLIGELTGNMREMFSESFSEINRNFKEIFVELFGGGAARLELTENEDILESGINIFVEPPGKIIKNLSSLSGGEQSFVAIAIYFAILKVRPAPFCLLDEIEAALDDVNVAKYAAYLRKMTNNTQFIAISHRRGTMEEADALYGVTMQDEGISKLLRLQLSEALEGNLI